MNSSATLRASFYGPNSPLGPPPGHLRNTGRHTIAVDVEAARKRNTLVPVDWASYSSYCRQIKEEANNESIYSVDVEQGQDTPTVGAQVRRMFTVWPYRDANWVIAVLFVVGSVSFTINAFFGLLVGLLPETVFPGEVELAIPLTNLFGALQFVTAGVLSLVAGWNADKGTFEPVTLNADDGTTKLYKPALLGSSAWSWIPSLAECKIVLRTVPFQSSLVQFIGGCILSISTVGGWPGVFAPDDLMAAQLFVFTPLAVGGTLFFFANLSLTIWLQDHWYKPKPGSAAWQGAFCSSVGSFCFALIGFFLLLGDTPASAVASFVGSWMFLIGAVLQWYDLMAFHPNNWAG